MDADGLKELFQPFGAVTVKRMFGGHGVYAQDLCFAVESGGEAFLKVDAQSQPDFSAAGSSPFIYMARGKPMTTSYWRLSAKAHDEGRRTAPLGRARARGGAARGRSQGG